MAFTQEQVGSLSSKLDISNVKTREQAGRKLSYIEGWHAIAEANRIFGYDRWDRETVDIRLVTEHPRKIGKGQYEKDGFGVGYIAKVRVIVRADGEAIIREGTGYGSGIDADVGSAHESAIKEAETDAMKRALMTFGNPFGLALYDKDQENVERNGSDAGASQKPNGSAHKVAPAAEPKASERREEFFQRENYEIDPKRIGGLQKWEKAYRAAARDCKDLKELIKLERDNANHLADFNEASAPPVNDALLTYMQARGHALTPKHPARHDTSMAQQLNDEIPF